MKAKVSVLLVGVLVLLVVGVLQGVGRSIPAGQEHLAAVLAVSGKECALSPKPREFNAAPYYEGPLIDAHLHMPVSSSIVASVGRRMGFEHMPAFGGALTPEYLACLFKSEGITKVIGFFMTTKFSLSSEVRLATNFEKKYPGLIAPFFMPGTNDTLRVATSTVRSTVARNKGLFKGIGEIKMFDNGSILRPVFLSHYDFAREHGLVVMLHPYEKHRAEVVELLRRYPDVKFLFHGGRDAEWVTEFMGQHPNVHYSIDADAVGLYGSGGPKEGRKRDPSKEEFIVYFRGHFDEILRTALAQWKTRIEAHPDRFMWGTDRWYDWHFDYEVGGLLEEFGRAFIGRLSPAVQEKFAHQNAEAFLKGR